MFIDKDGSLGPFSLCRPLASPLLLQPQTPSPALIILPERRKVCFVNLDISCTSLFSLVSKLSTQFPIYVCRWNESIQDMNKLMNSINHGNTTGSSQLAQSAAWLGVLFVLYVQSGLTAPLGHICVVTFTIQKTL